ncbi:MAG: hypothetical protein OEL88_08500 [Sterolibacteriaceae bacterium MAG5]|nr:hypothetical protein [Candidatus Nitricoxidireducens bremensis]
MINRLIGVVALMFVVAAASACPGDKAKDDGKGAPDGKKPTTSLTLG